MGYLVKMPQMGMSMDEGEVVEWVVDEGEEVEEEDVVVIVESEKASNEVAARESGVLRRILIEEGGVVEPGDPIGILAGPDEDISGLEEQAEGVTAGGAESDTEAEAESATAAVEASGGSETDDTSSDDVRATPGATRLAEEEGIDLTAVEGSGPGGAITEDDVQQAVESGASEAADSPKTDGQEPQTDDVRSTPGATRLAEEEGIDLTAVEGSGPGGAITEDDVQQAIESGAGGTAEVSEPTAEPGAAEQTVAQSAPLSGMQKTISERLSESYRNAVHVTINREFETAAMDESLTSAKTLGIDISLNDILLKAIADTLAEYPEFNALYEDGEHKQIEEINIGVAVDNEQGLLTPVVPDVDEKSLAEVNDVRRTLTESVLDNDYSMDDLQGGTFTISNLGMFGVDHFDPVINPPQVAILGVGRTRDDGRMTLSLSFDHRVLNGADAARFLDALVERLTSQEDIASYFSNRP